MMSIRHETLTDMFRQCPDLAAQLLTNALGLEVPAYQHARVEPGECTVRVPVEYRADAVIVLAATDGPALAVVVEVQLGQDPDKRLTWPLYLATVRARLGCPTAVLVLCVDPAIAAWCADPIELGPGGSTVYPLVVQLDQVPMVTDPEEAGRTPELTVLSALAHGADPEKRAVLDALLAALAAVDQEHRTLYSDIVHAALPTAARRYLEELVRTRPYEYQSDFVRSYVFQGRAEGEVKGRSQAVLAVLEARGVAVPDDARTQITECADLDQLDTWIRRAATAGSVHDLFA